jgi:hypothetical protein
MAKGIKTGGRQKGVPNRATADIREAAREYTTQALKTLVEVMEDTKQPGPARVAASNAILDRGFGKPTQPLEHSGEMDLRTWLSTVS